MGVMTFSSVSGEAMGLAAPPSPFLFRKHVPCACLTFSVWLLPYFYNVRSCPLAAKFEAGHYSLLPNHVAHLIKAL